MLRRTDKHVLEVDADALQRIDHIAVLEAVRELLRTVEDGVAPELREPVLETRLLVDREIENLRATNATRPQ
jgi:hypothetical protein